MRGCIMGPAWGLYALLAIAWINSPSATVGVVLLFVGVFLLLLHWFLGAIDDDTEQQVKGGRQLEAAELQAKIDQAEAELVGARLDQELSRAREAVALAITEESSRGERPTPRRKRSKLSISRPLGDAGAGRFNKIAGIWYRRSTVEHVLRQQGTKDGPGYTLKTVAALTRAPKNRHDANAIEVHVDGYLVGFVTAYKAESIAPDLDAFEARGYRLEVDAELTWDGIQNGEYSGRIKIPNTQKLLPES